MSIERVYLDRDTMVKCYKTAAARNDIKSEESAVIYNRPGREIHFDALRSEIAMALYILKPELVSFSVDRFGDGGTDLILGGSRIQVKSSVYDPPYLRFNMEGPQAFNAELAVLARVPLMPNGYDPEWMEKNNWVDLWGWINREEFLKRAERVDFGHGERLVVKPPLRDITNFRVYRY